MTTRPTVLVSGPTDGIGLELARLLAKEGHPLALAARRATCLEEVAVECRALGAPSAETFVSDLAEPGGAEALVGEIARRGLAIGILVNNAGFGVLGEFAASDREEQLRILRLNVEALVELTHRLLPSILAAGPAGGILNVASTAAFQAGPYMAVYYATKAFVLSFSEAIAIELEGKTRVSCLCPGPTPTGFQARAGFGENLALTSGLLPLLSAAQVARAGLAGFRRGKRVVIPGFANKATAIGTRAVPRGVAARVAGALQKKRER